VRFKEIMARCVQSGELDSDMAQLLAHLFSVRATAKTGRFDVECHRNGKRRATIELFF